MISTFPNAVQPSSVRSRLQWSHCSKNWSNDTDPVVFDDYFENFPSQCSKERLPRDTESYESPHYLQWGACDDDEKSFGFVDPVLMTIMHMCNDDNDVNSLEGLFTVLTARFPILARISGSERSCNTHLIILKIATPASQSLRSLSKTSTQSGSSLKNVTTLISSFTYILFSRESLGRSNR